MSGFEFTPAGIQPIGATQKQPSETDAAVAGATTVTTPTTSVAAKTKVAHVSAPMRPKDVVKLARARLREVERDIARLHKLERERDELKRLLAAADNRPVAIVRTMPTRSA